jgi:DNA-binding IclR family transcriptional regulator
VDTLREQGGCAPGSSVRRLGRLIGERRSTVHNALAMLIASGVIERIGGDLVLRG